MLADNKSHGVYLSMVIFLEHKLQIIANLANFGYDPINYQFFRTLNVIDLFLDVLAEEDQDKEDKEYNDTMIQFAIGGICNCCLGGWGSLSLD